MKPKQDPDGACGVELVVDSAAQAGLGPSANTAFARRSRRAHVDRAIEILNAACAQRRHYRISRDELAVVRFHSEGAESVAVPLSEGRVKRRPPCADVEGGCVGE